MIKKQILDIEKCLEFCSSITRESPTVDDQIDSLRGQIDDDLDRVQAYLTLGYGSPEVALTFFKILNGDKNERPE